MGAREDLYNLAFSAYQAKRYDEAVRSFTRLVLQSPFEEKYWKGLAASSQMAQKYEEALSAWALAALFAPQDPTPHVHAAECYFLLDNKEEGRKALKAATHSLPGWPNSDPLKAKISQLEGLYAQ